MFTDYKKENLKNMSSENAHKFENKCDFKEMEDVKKCP